MSISPWLRLRDGVSAVRTGDSGVVVEGHGVRLSFRADDPAVAESLLGLVPPGGDENRLADSLIEAAGPDSLARWYHAVERLSGRGLLCRSIRDPRGPLATLVPVSTSTGPGGPTMALSRLGRCRLSRFAYLRREGDSLVLEAPTAPARVILHDPAAAALVARLAFAAPSPGLIEPAGDTDDEAVPAVLRLLAAARMLEPVDEGEAGEEGPIACSLDAWEFHDLLFHARSRRGRTDAPFGATYRLAGRMDVPPPVRPIPPGSSRPLFRPDLSQLEAKDPPLARLMEDRRSERSFGRPPINARQLGEFLYRVARVRAEQELEVASPAGERGISTAVRPYPSGGALYELELYVAVAACDEVEAGLHYYEPRGHALIRVCGPTPEVGALLDDAAASAGIRRESLQVVLIISARVPRISWKYASMAYALVLKHVGVVFHSMYLAATAMGLAPCALGAGDSDVFARAARTDYYAETSVGEFLLGSRSLSDSGSP